MVSNPFLSPLPGAALVGPRGGPKVRIASVQSAAVLESVLSNACICELPADARRRAPVTRGTVSHGTRHAARLVLRAAFCEAATAPRRRGPLLPQPPGATTAPKSQSAALESIYKVPVLASGWGGC